MLAKTVLRVVTAMLFQQEEGKYVTTLKHEAESLEEREPCGVTRSCCSDIGS